MTGAFLAGGSYCAFGKLPSRADFVHIGPGSNLFARFADWLTDGVEWAQQKNGPIWGEAFRAGSMRAFMYRGDIPGLEHALVVGALAPSRDEAGRLFPICVAVSVVPTADFVKSPHLLPLACENIWQLAGESLAELSSSPNADLGAHLVGLGGPSIVSFSESATAYEAWCEALQLSELAALVTGSEQTEALHGVLRLISAAVQPHRKQESPVTPLSLRLPLGAAGGAAVCFWLDVVRRLIGWRATVPSFFWSQEGDSGQLTLHLGSAPVATVSEMWLPSTRSAEFCDLVQPLPARTLEALAPLPGALEQALRDRTGSVARLLTALSVAS